MRTFLGTLLIVVVLAVAYLAFRGASTAPQRESPQSGAAQTGPSVSAPGSEADAGAASSPGSIAEPESARQDATALDSDTAVSVVQVRAEGPAGIPAGEPFDAVVVLSFKPGWHANANPASDEFLIPTEITTPEGSPAEIVRVAYPEAERKKFAFSEAPLAVYDGEVRIPVTLRMRPGAQAAAPADAFPLDVTYQPCNDEECLAPATVTVTVKAADARGS